MSENRFQPQRVPIHTMGDVCDWYLGIWQPNQNWFFRVTIKYQSYFRSPCFSSAQRRRKSTVFQQNGNVKEKKIVEKFVENKGRHIEAKKKLKRKRNSNGSTAEINDNDVWCEKVEIDQASIYLFGAFRKIKTRGLRKYSMNLDIYLFLLWLMTIC